MNNKICSFCQSGERVIFSGKYGDYLCHKHYMQAYHTGKLKTRFKKEPNEIAVYEDYAEIILYNMGKEEKARTKIDLDDIEKCSKIKWSLHAEGYAYGIVESKDTNIGDFILNNQDHSLVPDHIDHNRLNNQKYNLRLVTYSQNNMNAKIRTNNTSGYNGISYNKRDNIWEAYISFEGKRVEHEYFEELEDAINQRKQWEQQYFKEFSYNGEAI